MSELTVEIFKKELEKGLDKGFEKQAVLINSAFQAHQDHFDKQVDDLRNDLKTDIIRVEAKVDKALHTEIIRLDARLIRVEQKLGINPAH